MTILIVIALATIALIVDNQALPQTPNKSDHFNQVRIIDGDTIRFDTQNIRLYGIDAPELNQTCQNKNILEKCGVESKDFLSSLLVGKTLECDDRGFDRWNRKLSVCRANGLDINQLMVRNGWAIAYREYSSNYVLDEEYASSQSLGMWSTNFVTPSDWRKDKNEQ